MFRVQWLWKNGVGTFHYFLNRWYPSNNLFNNPKGYHIQNLGHQKIDIPTYHSGVHQTIGFYSSSLVIRVLHIWRNGGFYFYYCVPWWDLFNGLSSDPNGDPIQKLCTQEVNIPTYDFRVQKIVDASYYSVMFRVNSIYRNGVWPFHYHVSQWKIQNNLVSDWNKDRMQKVRTREVDVQTYHINVYKIVGFSYYRVMFRVHYIQIKGVVSFHIILLYQTFPMVPWENQIKIVCKNYAVKKLTYQPTNSGFTKVFQFHILQWCLRYTSSKCVLYASLAILLLGETSPMFSRATQTNIVCKSYTAMKSPFQFTVSRLTKLLLFHHLE